MPYTPAKLIDEPIDGVPRITEEEFQELASLGESMSSAKKKFHDFYEEILTRYGRTRTAERWHDGLPKTIWNIQGHNIVKADVIY